MMFFFEIVPFLVWAVRFEECNCKIVNTASSRPYLHGSKQQNRANNKSKTKTKDYEAIDIVSSGKTLNTQFI